MINLDGEKEKLWKDLNKQNLRLNKHFHNSKNMHQKRIKKNGLKLYPISLNLALT